MTARLVRAIPVPAGEAVLGLLPALRAALAGDGPALLPLAAGDPRAGAIADALCAGSVLGAGEDSADDPTALVIATSGSTGTPKGVLLSAGQLAASAAATEARLGGAGTWLLTLPASHIAGMQVLLRAARAGAEPVVLPGDTSFTTTDFLAHAQRMRGPRRYVSLVPTQLGRILADPDAVLAAAEIFDAVLVGGAAIPAPMLAAARAAGIRVVTTYGMSETCGGCVYDGLPLDEVSVAIGERGAIRLTGPMVARGYRGLPGHPAFAPARARGGGASVRAFVTSDLGEIGSGGRLFVHGRLDDMIITGGVNVAPAAVEAAIRELPGVADVLVTSVPDAQWGQAVVALIVGAAGAQPWTSALLRDTLATRGALTPAERPRRVIPVSSIPQLASGKPDRAAAAALAKMSTRPGPRPSA